MIMKHRIENIFAHEIIDSRANPTLEVVVSTEDGYRASASVPSGASTGTHEAYEMRDENASRYHGKGVRHAVENVNSVISSLLCGRSLNYEYADRK